MKPNILFAFADDWGRYASAYARHEGPAGINHHLSTPNFDRIVNEGALFRNAYVPAPSCTPCRSSILSGRYFWQTGLGAILQGAEWDESIPSYPLTLQANGYHIGYTYKVWGPGRPPNAPYGVEGTAYHRGGNKYGGFSFYVTDRAAEIGVEAAKEELYNETRENFEEFLEAREPGQPFCYWWGPTNTHRRWQKGSGKALWGIEPDELKGNMPAFLPDVHAIREDVADYLGECQAVDGGLGVLIDKLEEIGELDNTLIVVSGDHGIPGMPRGKCNLYDLGCEVALGVRWPGHVMPGRVIEDQINLLDWGPTFCEVGQAPIPPGMTGRSLLNLLESEKSGQVEEDRTFVVTGRERHVASAREGNLPYPQRAIRTREYLYIRNFAPDRWPMGDPKGMDDPNAVPLPVDVLEQNTFAAYADMDASPTKAWMIHHRADEDVKDAYQDGFGKRPAEELFDIRNDPDHLNNLAGKPEFDSVREHLCTKLMQVLAEQDDPRVTEARCRFEHSPYSDPVDVEAWRKSPRKPNPSRRGGAQSATS